MPLEKDTPKELQRKVRDAAWLARLSGGRLKVTYDPQAILVPDDPAGEEGRRCVFDVSFDDDSGFDSPEMYLDDRGCPIGDQLVKELRRVGRLHLALANQMKAAITKRTLLSFEEDAYAIVVVRRPDGWEPHRLQPQEDDLESYDNEGRLDLITKFGWIKPPK